MSDAQTELLLELLRTKIELDKERNKLLDKIDDKLIKIYGGMP